MTARRYIIVSAIIFLILSALTIVFNYRVDPYLVFGSVRVDGFNKIKPAINEHVQTSKAHYPYLREWDTLLVGNSRIELGLDPQHRCFQDIGAKVYNLGIPGAGVGQQLSYALSLIYDQPIKRVFLGVDFVDFLVRDGTAPPAPNSRKPPKNLRYAFDGSANPDYRWGDAMDRYRALYSLDALIASMRTVAFQSSSQPDRDNHGFNPARDMKNAVMIEGVAALFDQKLSTLEDKYRTGWSLRYNDGSRARDFQVLADFLTIARSRGIDVTVFTNPFHEEFWTLLKQHGLYDAHAEWLEILTSQLSTNSVTPRFWDFSSDSDYIHEQIPRSAVRTEPLQWFWEPSRYRRELGDLMLDAMLANECESKRLFGKELF